MATNILQRDGIVFEATNGSGASIASGKPIILGDQSLTGWTIETIANGSAGSVLLSGITAIVNFPVKGNNGTADAAVAQYDKVYYTATEAFMDTDTAQAFVGFALEAVTSGATTTVMVALCGPIA